VTIENEISGKCPISKSTLYIFEKKGAFIFVSSTAFQAPSGKSFFTFAYTVKKVSFLVIVMILFFMDDQMGSKYVYQWVTVDRKKSLTRKQ